MADLATRPVDWTKPLETNENPPRSVRLSDHGVSGGAIGYVAVEIIDDGRPDHPLRAHAHPAGVYAAERVGGELRGDLAVRNVLVSEPMANLAGLIERVRAATGPDRSLDLAIGIALLDWGDTPAGEQPPPGRPEYSQPDGHFTGSVDAALALVERVRPGAIWAVARNAGGYDAGISWTLHDVGGSTVKPAATPALAVIIALLASLTDEP